MPEASTVELAHIHCTTDPSFKVRLKIVAAAEKCTMGELLVKLSAPEVDRLFEAIRTEGKPHRRRRDPA